MNTRAARAKCWGRISQLLSDVAAPHPFQIEPGGLSRMGADRAIAFWFEGESEKAKTMGNVMVTHKVAIKCYWRIPKTDDVRARTALELEIWDTTRAIQEAFHADSDLAETVTRLDFGMAQRLGDVQVGTGVEAGDYMVLDLPLFIQELEAEEVAA